jgi:hypothetical protein
MLKFQLKRATLPISADQSNPDERKEKDGGEFACAERGSPDAHQRRKSLSNTRRGSTQPADLSICAGCTDEGYTNERTRREEKDPPGARDEEFAPFLLEQPEPRVPR